MKIAPRIRGEFEYSVMEYGKEVLSSNGPIKNLVLDNMFNFPALLPSSNRNNNFYNVMIAIGSGVQSQPKKTDTSLGNQVAISSYKNSLDTQSKETGDENYVTIVYEYSHDFSGINGDITEIGLVEYHTGLLITKSLIKDTDNNPVSIPLSSFQTLRIRYRLYIKLPRIIKDDIVFSTPYGDIDLILGISPYRVPDAGRSKLNSTGYFFNGNYLFFQQATGTAYDFRAGGTQSYFVSGGKLFLKLSYNVSAVTRDRAIGCYGDYTGGGGWSGNYKSAFITTQALSIPSTIYTLFMKNENQEKVILPANHNLKFDLEIEIGAILDEYEGD